jgi:hypothetical protein
VIRTIRAVAVVLVVGSTGAAAQQSRTDLLRSATAAYDDFAPERALDLVKAAVNPALGPADTTWTRGVHLLTQILVEAGNQDQARTWARWAMRTAPGMAIDSVNFLAGVGAVLREARTFTSARTGGDAVTQTSWRWSARGSTEANGRIVLGASVMPVPVSVRVVGGGLISAAGTAMPPGSYEIEAGAPGYLPARVTREVLPGVATTLVFSLTSAAVASDVIAENVRQHTFQNVVALTVRRFASAPACVAGTFVNRDGLVLTTYKAIRGADSVSLASGGAPLRLAAYDVAADLAVLQVPGPRTDSIVPAAQIADGQSAWGIRFADCRTPSESRVRVTQWNERPRGALQLGEAPAGAAVGSPLVDVAGRLAGLWTGENTAIAGPALGTLLATARRNLTAGQMLSTNDVARRESHAYGSMAIAADVAAATVRVTPLETWQWSTLQANGAAPLTFIGPMGRYRVAVTAPGGAQREQDVTIRPGAHERHVIALRNAVAGGGSAPTIAKKKSKLPWILGGVAAVGAGAALALGGGGGGTPPPPPPTTGTITVTIPTNPPFRSPSPSSSPRLR